MNGSKYFSDLWNVMDTLAIFYFIAGIVFRWVVPSLVHVTALLPFLGGFCLQPVMKFWGAMCSWNLHCEGPKYWQVLTLKKKKDRGSLEFFVAFVTGCLIWPPGPCVIFKRTVQQPNNVIISQKLFYTMGWVKIHGKEMMETHFPK